MQVQAVRDFLLLRRLKSVKTKTILIILPIILVVLVAIIAEAFVLSRQIIVDQTRQRMTQQLGSITHDIEKAITAHSKITEAMAKGIEAKSSGFTLSDYQELTQRTLDANPNTFGMGVYFEPFKIDPKIKYFSTYAFKDKNGQKSSTEEYSDPKYDYPTQSWYTVVGKNGEKGIQFTDPYYDAATDVTMVTTTVPLFDDQKHFIGVATGDIDLSTIQKMIAETKVGTTGWAFLTDSQGTYIAGTAKDKIMKMKVTEEKTNASLADLGKTMLSTGNGDGMFTDDKGLNNAFYTKIPSTGWYLVVVIPDKELGEPLTGLLKSLAIISLVGIFIIIAAIYLYSRSITNNVKKVNELSQHMTDGDFTHVIDLKSRDEFGTMSANFNQSTAMIRQMLEKVTNSTLHVAATSQELSASAEETSKASESIARTIQEVAAGADTQLTGAEETARAMEEMSVGIQKIAESSSAAAESSAEAANEAKDGNHLVQKAVHQMGVISQAMDNTSDVIGLLDQRSKEIGTIVNVISSISTQTNLLALNASIEAARAGEHGRGFAVVAGEVKKLAEQTKQSAEQVVELILMIQNDAVEAVRVMDTGSTEVKKGTEIVNEAGAAFENILLKIQDMFSQVQEVSAASEQMSASSEEVTASMSELARIARDASLGSSSVAASSEQQMAAMEQVSASAMSLDGMVQELQSLIGKFKV